MTVVDPLTAAGTAGAPPAAPADTTAGAPPAPPAAPAAPAAPVLTLTAADIAAIASQIAATQAPVSPADAAAAAAAAPVQTSPVNLFTNGQVVKFVYADPYDGETTRYGMVVDTLPDEGAGARSILAWFDAVSGPIGDHLLAAG
jgi:hypothetical protein